MSIKKSLYDLLILESNDQSRTIDLTSGVILFEYYEDLFSPTITAKVKVVNNGNVIPAADNTDGDKQSIYNGLPLRGGERLSLKIAGNSSTNPGLDFSKNPDDYLYVSSITDVSTLRGAYAYITKKAEAIHSFDAAFKAVAPTTFWFSKSAANLVLSFMVF